LAVAVLGVLATGCGEGSDEVAVPHAEFVRGCSERVEGRLESDWRSQSVVAGALAFPYARLLADERRRPGRLWVEKVLAVVEPGESVTVVVPPRERSHVALIYEPEVWGRWSRRTPRLSDGHSSVRLTACRDERPHTQFNGGFLVRWPHCARLEVFSGGERLDAAIPFGERCVGSGQALRRRDPARPLPGAR
jgi:hypothetical protein